MREIKASEFKAKCLKLIDEVNETGEPIVITKRGKTVARLEAARPARVIHLAAARRSSKQPIPMMISLKF